MQLVAGDIVDGPDGAKVDNTVVTHERVKLQVTVTANAAGDSSFIVCFTVSRAHVDCIEIKTFQHFSLKFTLEIGSNFRALSEFRSD